jgi:8-oxo-dGTP diphosphatase
VNLDYDRLQADAEDAGRRCVVGALITDDAGRVLIVRRAETCEFLPGCWDVVGGHVDAGESLLDALTREVEEETGWTGAVPEALLAVDEWHGADGNLRREFDFLVGVDGDLARPRLAPGEHSEHRWIGPDEIGVVDENAGVDRGLVRRSVELALAAGASAAPRPHATILLLDPAVAAPVEALRRRWDPAMASQIGAHVTVTYPDEVGDTGVLRACLAEITSSLAPFRLGLGGVAVFDRPEGGCYVEVDDRDGGYARLREAIVGTAAATGTPPHVTIVHPRTSGLGQIAWDDLEGLRLDAEVTVREVTMTAFDGRAWRPRHRFVLRG